MVQKNSNNLSPSPKKLKFRGLRLLSPKQQLCLGSLAVPEGLEGIWIGQFGKDVVGVPKVVDLHNADQFLVPLLGKAVFCYEHGDLVPSKRPGWIFYFSHSQACRVLSIWSNMLCLSFTAEEMDRPLNYIERDARLTIWNLSKGLSTEFMAQQNFKWATYLVPLNKISKSPLTLKDFIGY